MDKEGIIMRSAAFTKALYYPYIDIRDSEWLKTAILFWDEISTIVPESVDHPYNKYDTEYLEDKEILKQIRVHSDHPSVIDIEDEVIRLLLTPEIMNSLIRASKHTKNGIYRDKMSHRLHEELSRAFKRGGVYSDKMSHNIKHRLREVEDSFCRNGIYYLEDNWVQLYMTILTNKICENKLALVTDDVFSYGLANSVKLDNQLSFSANDRHSRRHCELLRQGLLLNLIVEGLRISPETPLPNIVEFKEKQRDSGELAAFREVIFELTQGINVDQSISDLRSEIEDLYKTKFNRAYKKLKSSLKRSRIKYISENFLKIACFTIPSTSIPIAFGTPIPQALLSGACASLVATTVLYNVNKEEILCDNPYSYLLMAEREFN
jgi:DNA-binding transcriptional MerR regulator